LENLKTKLKIFVKRYFYYFTYFYQHLGNKMLIAFFLSMCVALMDGLGLTMFLPLLELIDGGTSQGEGLGGLGFVVDWLKSIGLELTVPVVLLFMVSFFIIKGGFKFIESYYATLLRRNFIKKLRFSTVDLLIGYNFLHFTKADSGRIQNTVSGEVVRVVTAFSNYFFFLQAIAMIVVYVTMAMNVNPQFTLFVVLGGLLSNMLYSVIYKKTKIYSIKITENTHLFQGFLIQLVGHFKYLKATGTLKKYGVNLKEKIQTIEDQYINLGFLSSVVTAIREPIIVVIVIGVILLEILVFGGSLGAILLSLLFFYRSLTYLMALQGYWNEVMANYGSLENIKSFMNELKIGEEHQGSKVFQRFHYELCFDCVCFGISNQSIINDVSFKLKKNQTMAIVGESGSGKTTLMNLISGLLLPDKGYITIDGISIADLNRESLQSRIGYITQEPVIFNDTVFNNVTFWDKDTPENRGKCREALRKASVLDFIDKLENKENESLGNNGIIVSGGQKQRIAIARELYKQVDFLLMDEATSALDSEVEKNIQMNIDALKGKITIIIIAHRLSTVRNADNILLLREGMLEQQGTFSELVTSSPQFKKMVSLQEF
tara:strand:+ start:111212 stop:113017 length:1806 start_codon:yes stop_codon:yes gene_type:complete